MDRLKSKTETRNLLRLFRFPAGKINAQDASEHGGGDIAKMKDELL